MRFPTGRNRRRTVHEPNYWTDRLFQLRTRLGIDQRTAAARVGISREAWLLYETGQRLPFLSHALLLDQFVRHPKDFAVAATLRGLPTAGRVTRKTKIR